MAGNHDQIPPASRYASYMIAEKSPDNEALQLELQEALVSYRHFSSQFTQATGFLVTANVALVSYGFSQRFAAILLMASIMPLVVLVYFTIIGSIIGPLIDLMLRIERKLLIREDSIGAIVARTNLGKMIPAVHGRIEDLADEEVRRIKFTWGSLWSKISIALYALTAGQIALFVLSLTVFHYRFM